MTYSLKKINSLNQLIDEDELDKLTKMKSPFKDPPVQADLEIHLEFIA